MTLDGPSGSGKSTVARAVAQALGWRYVDTGATYRAATLAVLRAGADLTDPAAVTAVVASVVDRRGIVLDTAPAASRILLDGADVSAEIRSAAVTSAVSAVSAVSGVRTLMVDLQRAAIGADGAVAEGRDVGTVVVPDAAVKVFLDADPAVRAVRRAQDTDSGVPTDARADLVTAVAADLQRRDLLDSSRADSPLIPAETAIHLDATALTAPQVIERVLQLATEAGLR